MTQGATAFGTQNQNGFKAVSSKVQQFGSGTNALQSNGIGQQSVGAPYQYPPPPLMGMGFQTQTGYPMPLAYAGMQK